MKQDHKQQHIRSYVRRQGRLTDAQANALFEYWSDYGLELDQNILDWSHLFARQADIVLEIGFGNGESLLQQAIDEPDKNFFGIEVHAPGVGHFLHQCHAHDLTNVRMAKEDAVLILADMVPDLSLSRVQIYFPDPWPKKRHHKRRLIQPELVDLLVRKCKPEAIIHLATDWLPYAEHMLEVLNNNDYLSNLADDAGFSQKPAWRPETKFERRGHKLGHCSYDLLFIKMDQAQTTR